MKTNDILLAHDFGGNCWYFMQVVKTTEKTVTVRQIMSNRMAGMPKKGEFFGEPITRKVSKDGRIRVSDYTSAGLWDGHPLCIMGFFGMNQNLY